MTRQSLLTTVAILAAQRAGSITKKGFGSVHEIVKKPGKLNFVTEYDQAAEKAILETISHHFPTHHILAEESGHSGDLRQEEILWVIDPIDGTLNFARHMPFYVISIAAMHKGEILTGVIYDPSKEELFVAEKGKGAYLNGQRLRVSQKKEMNESVIGIGLPVLLSQNKNQCLNYFHKITQHDVALRNFGAAALHLAYVAANRCDAFVCTSKLAPWDVAAGILLLQEAQGMAVNIKGADYDIMSCDPLIAAGKPLCKVLIQILQ